MLMFNLVSAKGNLDRKKSCTRSQFRTRRWTMGEGLNAFQTHPFLLLGTEWKKETEVQCSSVVLLPSSHKNCYILTYISYLIVRLILKIIYI
jgi:hypothetical protein